MAHPWSRRPTPSLSGRNCRRHLRILANFDRNRGRPSPCTEAALGARFVFLTIHSEEQFVEACLAEGALRDTVVQVPHEGPPNCSDTSSSYRRIIHFSACCQVMSAAPQSAIASSLSEQNSHEAATRRKLLLPHDFPFGERYMRENATNAHLPQPLKTVSPRARVASNQDKDLGRKPA